MGTNCDGGGGYPIIEEHKDTATWSVGDFTQTSSFHRHKADSLDTESFWTIKCCLSSDAEAHLSDDASQPYDQLYNSDFEVQWDDQKYPNKNNVDAEISKDHIGAMDALYDGDGYDDGDIWQTAIEYGRDQLIGASPAGWLWSVGKVVGSMVFDYVDNHNHQDSWGTRFDWAYNGSPQVSWWNRFDVELYEDQSLTLSLSAGAHNDYDLLNINFDYTVYAPSTAPSTVKKMSTTDRQQSGIVTIPAETVRKNPRKYGITGKRRERLKDAEELYVYRGVPKQEIAHNAV